jgi:hypothetical protein
MVTNPKTHYIGSQRQKDHTKDVRQAGFAGRGSRCHCSIEPAGHEAIAKGKAGNVPGGKRPGCNMQDLSQRV